jgi:hypothetical protein
MVVVRNVFLITRGGTPEFDKDTWRHNTKFRLTERRYKTVHGYKYVSAHP